MTRKSTTFSSAFFAQWSWFRNRLRLFLLLGLLGLLLAGAILQGELFLFPTWLEGISRLAYRGAFLLVAPLRPIVALFIPPQNHHWPISNLFAVALGAPYFYWLIGIGFIHVHRKAMRRRTVKRSDVDVPFPERRQFLVRSMAGMAGMTTGGMGAYVSIIEPAELKIRCYTIPIKGLSREFDGKRILHVSDTHYGPFTGLDFLNEVVRQANNLEPDLVLMTGDYIHFTPLSIEPGITLMKEFKSPLGSVAVMGNHEHWEGTLACRQVFERIAIPLVDNHRIFLTPEGLSPTPLSHHDICIAGVGDLWEDSVCFEKALHEVPTDMPRIMLSHNPDSAEYIGQTQRVDLMLSGHTHGGQVNIPGLGAPNGGSRYGYKYLGGLCKGPACPVIVSRGVGMTFLPVRFRVPPELGLITLRAC